MDVFPSNEKIFQILYSHEIEKIQRYQKSRDQHFFLFFDIFVFRLHQIPFVNENLQKNQNNQGYTLNLLIIHTKNFHYL